MKVSKMVILSLMLSLILMGAPACAADPADYKGSKDHPMFSRMPGFYIDSYETKQFEQYKYNDQKGNPITVEGHFFEISYCVKTGVEPPTELQIIRNHTNAIKKIGGTVIFESNKDAHLMVKKSGMETWVKVHPWNQGDCYTLYITEKQAMAQDVLADAKQMTQDIKTTGHVAVYGIYFDFNKSDLKPESEPTLKEIAKLFTENPSLKVFVVGHTDNVGKVDFNMKLSSARAEAVKKALISKHKINPQRMESHGVGQLAPVTSNRTEEGRAKNRRVELVEQ